MFVGDKLSTDVAGASAVGMTTCQALWFQVDADDAPEPDYRAFTQMDVLTIAGRLTV
jgi:FMN phosphatase YigB (HAD superfamily)